MCEACFIKGIRRFSSASAFAVFEQQLLSTALQVQQRPAGWPLLPLRALYEPDTFYRCGSCHQVWALAFPDNAWRGYFLPVDAARAYQRQLQRREAGIRYLAVVLLVAALWWALG